MIDKNTGEVLNAMWQDLKEMGAIGIYVSDEIISVQMKEIDIDSCEMQRDYTEKYDQAYKVTGGVKFFKLIEKGVL